jgi:hypothetical protein
MTNVELTENLESRPPQTEPRRRAHTFWDFEMPTRALDVVLAALALLGPFAIHLFFPVIPVVKSRCGASCRRACHIFIATLSSYRATLSNVKENRSASLLSARVTCPHSSQMNLSVPAVCVSGISRAQSCSCRCAVIFLQLRHSFVTIRGVSLPGKKRRRPAMILLVRHQLSAQLVPLRLRSHRAPRESPRLAQE